MPRTTLEVLQKEVTAYSSHTETTTFSIPYIRFCLPQNEEGKQPVFELHPSHSVWSNQTFNDDWYKSALMLKFARSLAGGKQLPRYRSEIDFKDLAVYSWINAERKKQVIACLGILPHENIPCLKFDPETKRYEQEFQAHLTKVLHLSLSDGQVNAAGLFDYSKGSKDPHAMPLIEDASFLAFCQDMYDVLLKEKEHLLMPS
jgi:hypothetical protein